MNQLQDIQNSRLRALATLELSREMPKWEIESINNLDSRVILVSTKPVNVPGNFWLGVLTFGFWFIIFLFKNKGKQVRRKILSANDFPFLENYLKAPFTKYMKNFYSQAGEDGVVLEILNRIGVIDKKMKSNPVCIEFGAWDGRHLSNTFHLVETYGWNAFYIEGDAKRFRDLSLTANLYPNITPVNSWISPNATSENSLNRILRNHNCPSNVEVLSIDVDSCDLDIWESLTEVNPLIVVIEVNSSIPPGILLRQGKNINGNSFSAVLQVASSKGYKLVAHTGNMILVKSEIINKLNIEQRFLDFPELLFRPEEVESFHKSKSLYFDFLYPLVKFYKKVSYKLIKLSRADKILFMHY